MPLMVQAGGGFGREGEHGLSLEIARQMTRLLAAVTLLDVLLRRAASGARGLGIWMENAFLSWWTRLGDAVGTWPRDALLLASILALVCLLPAARRMRRPAALLVAAASALLGVPVLLHRLGFPDWELPRNLLAAAILAAAAASRLRSRGLLLDAPLLLSSLGAACCSAWMAATGLDFPTAGNDALEAAGETLVLVAAAAAPLIAAAAGARGPRWSWVAWAATAGLGAWLFAEHTDACLHLVRHLFHLGEAGLPAWLLGALLALAVAAPVRLVCLGPFFRLQALVLLLLLSGARGPGDALLALRLATATLVAVFPVAAEPRWEPQALGLPAGG